MRLLLVCSILFALPLFSRASDASAVLDEINLARTHPHEYADIVEARMAALPGANERDVEEAAAFLKRQRPLDPLEYAPGLGMSAEAQVSGQGPTGEIGHRGCDGSSPWARMDRAGQRLGMVGENISYGYPDARSIVVTLIVDQGVPDRGHRRNIFRPEFKVAGAARGPHARYGAMCVIDFAAGFAEKGEKIVMADAWRGTGGQAW